MTQRMLAAYADMTDVSISRYISGDRAPRALALYRISKALNCTMEDLMYGVFD
jgi:transcriptional regulator with XRE-family HTH domain